MLIGINYVSVVCYLLSTDYPLVDFGGVYASPTMVGGLCMPPFPATRQYNRNIVALEWMFSSFLSIHIGKLMAGGEVHVGKSMRFHGISDWHQVIWPHESASSGNSINRKALSWYHGEHHRIRAAIYCLPAHSPNFNFCMAFIVSHICPTSLLYAKA